MIYLLRVSASLLGIVLLAQLSAAQLSCEDADIRLRGGGSPREGRVEICFNNEWGTVCDDGWDARDANVVCGQLGFSQFGAVAVSRAQRFGQGTGEIWLADLACTGSEPKLSECSHSGIGIENCGHLEDAGVVCQEFSNCTDGDVRLRNGSNDMEGRVEICFNGTWGTICDNQWDEADAIVVCEQLGHEQIGAAAVGGARYGSGTGPVWLDAVGCNGTELSITSCLNSDVGPNSCGHSQDAGVDCQRDARQYGCIAIDGFTFITLNFQVDIAKCLDRDIRLVNGPTALEGRVEICFRGEWGTVCDDLWGIRDAEVVCNELGHSTVGAVALSSARYGQGTGPIWLDDVQCFGREARLSDCRHSGIGVENCVHSEDASVMCQPGVSNCTDGEVRLVGGSDAQEGRVEICFRRVWGTICDDSWDDSDALVVCNQLGIDPRGPAAVAGSRFGVGIGPTWLEAVECNGTEPNVTSCQHSDIGTSSCGLFQNAGVHCQTAPPTVRISPEGPFVVQFNQTISLLCSSKSQRVVQFVWLLNGETISVTHRIAEYTTASNLTIPNISELGFGVYTCIVDDGFYDAVNESITVVETDELYFVGGQTTIQANTAIGGRLALVCPTVRGGIGNHTVSFVRGSSTLNSDLERVTVNSIPSGGIEVVIDPVLSEDAGRYRCTATDGVTSITLQYEVNFLECLDRDIRLVNGPTALEGRVEICLRREWGTVCDDLWGIRNAQVVCTELGHTSVGAVALSRARYGQGTGPIWLDDVQCFGREARLSDCRHSGIGVEDCVHSEDASVMCQPAANCSDGDVRLVNGSTGLEGRVEICYRRFWGTVCDNQWDSQDAAVICRQLGHFSTGATAVDGGRFGEGSGQVWIGDVDCTGNEAEVSECRHPGFGLLNCASGNAAGVQCQADTNCSDGEIRLVNGSTALEGRVEICFNGIWGSICNSIWHGRDAAVACRQLGYSAAGAQVISSSDRFGRSTGVVWLRNVNCSGTENNLTQCIRNVSLQSSLGCSYLGSGDASISCQAVSNCTDGDVRLVDGATEREGNVEVCFRGEWGIVCADGWGGRQTAVVCRQLGYRGFISMGSSCCRPSFEQEYLPSFLRDVRCNGAESSLLECSGSGLGVQNCSLILIAQSECTDPAPCLSNEFECPLGRFNFGSSPCISERRTCDGFSDCINGTDELNCPGIVTVGFSQLELSSLESGRSVLQFCIQVLSGEVVRPLVVIIESDDDDGTARANSDFRVFSVNLTINPPPNAEQPVIVCSTFAASDVIIDDSVLEFTEYFEVRVFPVGGDFRFIHVDPNYYIARVYIVDDEIVDIGFDSEVYSVSEGTGNVTLSVRRPGNSAVELARPIAVRVSSMEGSATAGSDYIVGGVLPQIAHLGAHSPPSQTWDISIPIVDDSQAESAESFTVHIFLTDLGVRVVQTTATVIILDNDGTLPVGLEAYFIGDTPRVEGSNIVFQVETNKPASLRCRFGSGVVACPIGQEFTIENVAPGEYSLRAIARAGTERYVASATLTVPDSGSCAVHLINRGVTVIGDTVTIEFAGAGPITSFSCALDDQRPQPCTSPLTLTGIGEGTFQLTVMPQGCNIAQPLVQAFTV